MHVQHLGHHWVHRACIHRAYHDTILAAAHRMPPLKGRLDLVALKRNLASPLFRHDKADQAAISAPTTCGNVVQQGDAREDAGRVCED